MSTVETEAIRQFSILLLQPDSIFRKRVQSETALGAYLRSVCAATSRILRASKERPVSGGFIVLAFQPNRGTRVWLDFSPALPFSLETSIIDGIADLPGMDVVDGVVSLTLRMGLWGGNAPQSSRRPQPARWRYLLPDAIHLLDLDEVLNVVWDQ